MQIHRRLRQAAVAALTALVLAPLGLNATAQEVPTVTLTGTFSLEDIQGTVGADLLAAVEPGRLTTWTLTMHDTSHEHVGSGSDPYRVTLIRSASLDLVFTGSGADALNDLVGAPLASGRADVELRNSAGTGTGWSDASIWVVPPGGVGTAIAFFAGHELVGNRYRFPADADGYPVVTAEPFEFRLEEVAIADDRDGNSGTLWSWEQSATIAGDLGGPAAPTLSILDASALEGDRGSRKVQLRVMLTSAATQSITVGYRTVDGTATADSDYGSKSGTLTFRPGETSKSVTVAIRTDRVREPDETFRVELFNAVGAFVRHPSATATIRNDD